MLGPIARVLDLSASDSDFKSSRLPRLSQLLEELFGEESQDEISPVVVALGRAYIPADASALIAVLRESK